MLKLNIGCGRNLFPSADGWLNLDISPDVGADLVHDLRQPLPFPESSFDELHMSHVLEHFPHPLPIMEELWRVAKPGAKLLVKVPYGSSDIAFEDPTHYRQYFVNSFMYFGQPAYAAADYGYRGDWQVTRRVLVVSETFPLEEMPPSPREFMEMVRVYRNLIDEFIVELEAVKPIRAVTDANTQAPVEFALRENLHG